MICRKYFQAAANMEVFADSDAATTLNEGTRLNVASWVNFEFWKITINCKIITTLLNEVQRNPYGVKAFQANLQDKIAPPIEYAINFGFE